MWILSFRVVLQDYGCKVTGISEKETNKFATFDQQNAAGWQNVNISVVTGNSFLSFCREKNHFFDKMIIVFDYKII